MKKLSKAGYHYRASKFKGDVCERCGVRDHLGVHHKDKNIADNSPDNLMTLCDSCHTKWHWENGKKQPAGCQTNPTSGHQKKILVRQREILCYMAETPNRWIGPTEIGNRFGASVPKNWGIAQLKRMEETGFVLKDWRGLRRITDKGLDFIADEIDHSAVDYSNTQTSRSVQMQKRKRNSKGRFINGSGGGCG